MENQRKSRVLKRTLTQPIAEQSTGPTLRDSLTRPLWMALLVLVTVVQPLTSKAAPIVWDAAADFSTTQNANGAWSYGWSQTLVGSPFVPLPPTSSVASSQGQWANLIATKGFEGWALAPQSNASPYDYSPEPNIMKNVLAGEAITPYGTISILPGQLTMHPGPLGEYAWLLWTAPIDGLYSIFAEFSGQVNTATNTTTDVHVLLNDTLGFSSFVNGSQSNGGSPQQYSNAAVLLSQGDTISFKVGYGNGDFGYDTTAVMARIEKVSTVPEPTTVSLLTLGILAVGAATRAGKKSKEKSTF